MLQPLVLDMGFPERLAAARKAHGLTQQMLAELVGVRVLQIYRYEAGTSQPTLEVIKKMALALNISTDELIFDKEERKPQEDFRLQFEAASRLDPDEKLILKALIDGLLLKHDAKRWTKESGLTVKSEEQE
jgi:transcriptional regulator with XRE-family HTH domain